MTHSPGDTSPAQPSRRLDCQCHCHCPRTECPPLQATPPPLHATPRPRPQTRVSNHGAAAVPSTPSLPFPPVHLSRAAQGPGTTPTPRPQDHRPRHTAGSTPCPRDFQCWAPAGRGAGLGRRLQHGHCCQARRGEGGLGRDTARHLAPLLLPRAKNRADTGGTAKPARVGGRGRETSE